MLNQNSEVNMSNELIASESNAQLINLYSKVGDPIQAAIALGNMFHQSGMFGAKTAQQGHVLAFECITRGLPPGKLIERFHIVESRLSMRADYMLAKFIENGGRVKWLRWDGEEARAIFTDKFKESYEFSYSLSDAKASKICFGREGQLKDNWAKSTPDMLRARLISKSVRMLDPGINSGYYTKEENEDEYISQNIPANQAPKKSAEDLIKESMPERKQEATDYSVVETKTIDEKIKALGDVAVKFLISKDWLKDGQTIADLPEKRKSLFERNFEGFENAIKEFESSLTGEANK